MKDFCLSLGTIFFATILNGKELVINESHSPQLRCGLAPLAVTSACGFVEAQSRKDTETKETSASTRESHPETPDKEDLEQDDDASDYGEENENQGWDDLEVCELVILIFGFLGGLVWFDLILTLCLLV